MNTIEKERRRHRISVKTAVNGIKFAFQTQPNFLYHVFFSFAAISFSVLFQISRLEWLVITLTIILGFVIEMANTAVESVVDLVTDVWHKDAKIAKDISAGMMLIFAYGSVAIAALVFFPYFLNLLSPWIPAS